MSRLKEAVLGQNTAYAGSNPNLSLTNGGQGGYMPLIGKIGADGKYVGEWISNQAYVRRNLIPIVIEYPKFFDFMPEPEKWIEAYKALIELHPLTIDGLTNTLTVDTDSHAVGGAGEEQEEIIDVKRAKSTLTFTYKEKAGKSIFRFLSNIIRYGYMDPDTKKPLVANYIDDLSKVGGMYTPEFYTGTILFIEPDVLMKTTVEAFLVSNVFFKTSGESTGKRDIKSAGEAPEYSIECSGITMSNEAVVLYANSILSKLTVINKLPDVDMTLPVGELDPKITTKVNGYNQA